MTIMQKWVNEQLTGSKKAFPVLSFPGLQLNGMTVLEAVTDGEKQADCMKCVADRFPTSAAVSFMDLSVEAEAFGSLVKFCEDEVPTVIGHVVATPEEVASLRIPDVGEKRTGECIKAISIATKKIVDRPVFAGIIGPFSLAGRLMEMTEIMINMFEEPEMVHALLEKTTTYLIAYAKAMKDTGCGGILVAEPAAGLISPEQNWAFSSIYVKRLVEAVQDDDFLVVLHNCGNTERMVDKMVATGAAGLHFGNAVDMEKILPQVPPKVLVMGNVDPARVMKNGTPEMVRDAVYHLVKGLAAYPNFVLSTGCDVPPGTPIENIDLFFETAAG